MTGAAGSGGGAAKPPGRLSKLLIGMFMKPAMVSAVADVADRYRLVTLEGEALRSVEWVSGYRKAGKPSLRS